MTGLAAYDLVVRHGTVVTERGRVAADVGVRDGVIAEIGRVTGSAIREIDATGLLVLPGAVESHCHLDQLSSSGITTADDFASGSAAAAAGGTTTIIPFAAQHRGQSLRDVVADYRRRAAGKAIVDYSFHLIVSDPDERALTRDLPALVAEGCRSFKVFTTYDALRLTDRQIVAVLQAARELDARMMVHAENADAIAWRTRTLLEAGCVAPKYHAVARPIAAEREAVHRVLSLAEVVDTPVVVVHVSGGEPLDEIRRARARGVRVVAETCPQYLFLTAADLDRPGFEGAKYVCSPPLRDAAAQDALWAGLADGSLDLLSSDHAPYRFDDPEGKAMHGTDAPFPKIPNGLPGLETCYPLAFSEGVLGGRFTLEQFVAMSATNAARTYGLYPRKGTIAVGSDADLALWDPEVTTTITNDRLHHRMDYTAYEGRTVRGWPVTTISRGEIVYEGGRVVGAPGRGLFLAR